MGTVGLLLGRADTVDPASGCILVVLQVVDYTHAGAVVACAALPAPFGPGETDNPVRWGLLRSALEAFPHSLLLEAFLDLGDTGRQEVHP